MYDDADSVRSNGDLDHVGGGVLGRMNFTNFGYGQFYVDGSFRAGSINNKYNSDLSDMHGISADYTVSSAYYGAHLGVGRTLSFANRSSLDLYGKCFWTQQQGDTVTLATDEVLDFDSVNSHRLRLGTRYIRATRTRMSPYFGAAWEHEFVGTAHATTQGHAINAPTLRGNTGVVELGISRKPTFSHGLYADLGMQGYFGKRDGISASLTIGRNF
jgi:outer membrane autotransporter protein